MGDLLGSVIIHALKVANIEHDRRLRSRLLQTGPIALKCAALEKEIDSQLKLVNVSRLSRCSPWDDRILISTFMQLAVSLSTHSNTTATRHHAEQHTIQINEMQRKIDYLVELHENQRRSFSNVAESIYSRKEIDANAKVLDPERRDDPISAVWPNLGWETYRRLLDCPAPSLILQTQVSRRSRVRALPESSVYVLFFQVI